MKNVNTKIILTLGLGLFLSACASNPNKAENIETKLVHQEKISGDTTLGIKNGDMVVQHKVLMSEEMRDVQIAAYQLQDYVYGNEQYGSSGQYGVLKECRMKLAQKENGGDGKITFSEPLDRVIPENEDMSIGLDEKNNLVGVSEEFLKARIERFRQYKAILQKRSQDLQTKQEVCDTDLKSQQFAQKTAQR